jgi:Type III restriction enzyme, res subunit
MRYELIDYQREAARIIVDRLRLGRDLWASSKMPSSFALSAITGAGKTVIAAAVIEALLHGSSDLGAEADPNATFLWITDDPALNRQTRSDARRIGPAPATHIIGSRRWLSRTGTATAAVLFFEHTEALQGEPFGPNRDQSAAAFILGNPR